MVPAVYRFIGAAFDATPTQLGYITLSRALVQALSAPLGGIAGKEKFHKAVHPDTQPCPT
jgi:hypothetical protein